MQPIGSQRLLLFELFLLQWYAYLDLSFGFPGQELLDDVEVCAVFADELHGICNYAVEESGFPSTPQLGLFGGRRVLGVLVAWFGFASQRVGCFALRLLKAVLPIGFLRSSFLLFPSESCCSLPAPSNQTFTNCIPSEIMHYKFFYIVEFNPALLSRLGSTCVAIELLPRRFRRDTQHSLLVVPTNE